MDRKKVELLAPAGSYEGFEVAIKAGADAVYAGGARFGARAYAKNFTQEELLRAIDTAHLHERKFYLTVNTLLKNREIREELYAYLDPLYRQGLDAVIVQDLGVFRFIRQYFPQLPVHASTQMTVTGPEGMRLLEKWGAARVVAARELSLEELSRMHAAASIEIEAFVHGALCYSYSGQCLMSSMFGGRSGNRGRCAQPCRLPYDVAAENRRFREEKSLCPLSLKDINTIEILPQIIEAGVFSLKLEGRMKQPGYTAGVTEIYRKYLDKLLRDGPEHYKVEEEDKARLLGLFSRGGSCRGYYQVHNGREMLSLLNEKKVQETPFSSSKTGEGILADCAGRLPQIPARGKLFLYPDSPAVLHASCRGREVTVSLGEVQHALKQPMESGQIRAQMNRTGTSAFVWEELELHQDGEIFVPVRILNELRRQAFSELLENLLQPYKRKAAEQASVFTEELSVVRTGKRPGRMPVYVSCETRDLALQMCRKEGIAGLYVPFDAVEECLRGRLSEDMEIYLLTPYVTRGSMPPEWKEKIHGWISEGLTGFLVRNLETFGMLKEMGLASRCVLDHGVYTWNGEAQAFWEEQGVLRLTAPLELNERELRHRENQNSEMVLYGYLPLMLSAQCVRKFRAGCNGREGYAYLRDRYQKEFVSACVCHPWKICTTEDKGICYNIIYNSVPLGLFREMEQVKALGMKSCRLSFTRETPEEADRILELFRNPDVQKGEKGFPVCTKGHFKRGAE